MPNIRAIMATMAIAFAATEANSQMAKHADCMDLQTLATAIDKICQDGIYAAMILDDAEADGLLETEFEMQTAESMRNLVDVCQWVADSVLRGGRNNN